VAGISANVTTVAGISSNVTTVAGVSANVTTVATNIAAVNTNATNIVAIQNASTNATNAANSATAAGNAQTAAEAARDATLAAYDNFDDRYLGSKTSNPTLDNDGNALVGGALYFNSVAGEMRVYTGSAWVAAYVSGTGFLSSANNLSDLASFSTARTNLGLVASATTDTTNASNISSGTLGAARLPAFTGDATSSAGSSALTLATVNSTTGTFGSSSSIPVVTVNGKGLVTSVTTSAVAGGQYFGTAASKAIAYNEDSISENITTTSGKNCLSVGPITINSGYSVTIASGQRWVIL